MDDKRKKYLTKKIEIKVKDKDDDLGVKNSNRYKRVLDELSKKDTKIINPDGDTEKISLDERLDAKLKCQALTKSLGAQKEDIKLKIREAQDPARMLLNRRMLELKRSREQYISRSRNQRVNRPQEAKREEKVASPKLHERISPTEQIIKKSKEDNQIDKEKTQETNLEVTKQSKTHNPKKISTVLKTVVTKDGDVKTFTEVAFVEPKKLTPLEIKIPTPYLNEKRSSKYFDDQSTSSSYHSISRTSFDDHIETAVSYIKKKKNINEIKKNKRRLPPKDEFLTEFNCSTPTIEMARFLPASFNEHTKPYYDAWVDTTLAAKTKHSPRSEKLWRGHEAKTYVSYLNGPSTPEIITNIDERYTGRIKITQR